MTIVIWDVEVLAYARMTVIVESEEVLAYARMTSWK
jgi:hypothetical protein